MKTAVIYGSKYGTAKVCAEYLKEKITCETFCVNDQISLVGFDQIIFGTSTYAGNFHKKLIKFYKEHKEELKDKKVSIYICGLIDDQNIFKDEIIKNFDDDCFSMLKHVIFAGGILKFPKMNFFERNIIRMINSKKNFIDNIDFNKTYDFLQLSNLDVFVTDVK